DHKVRAHAERFSRWLKRIRWRTDPVPEVFEVVIETSDHRERSIFTVHAVENRLVTGNVVREDRQRGDFIENLERRMRRRHAHQLLRWERLTHLTAEIIELPWAIEIVDQYKAAAIDVLPQIAELFFVQAH